MEAQLLGLQIRNRRESLDLKQDDLAEMAGITIKTLHLVESGKGNPSLETLNKINKVLGFDLVLLIKQME